MHLRLTPCKSLVSGQSDDLRQGGLLVSASVAILSLPSLEEIHWFPRFLFFETLMLSLLSVYFALLLQRELGMTDAQALRLWLWDGTTYTVVQDSNRTF